MLKYIVTREHWGDKQYSVGDTRTARPADVAHLVGRCLELKVEKKAKALSNKAESPVRNKAAK
jgi:hypothetical protein